jgi:predicted ATP-binding protein involved in virulence
MRLTRVKLRNIGGFETLDMPLDERLTVLVGVNGSGKSTVLAAIAQTLRATLDSTDGESLSYRLRRGCSQGGVELVGDHRERVRHAYFDIHTRADLRIVAESRGGLLEDAELPLPVACMFPDRRAADDRTPSAADLEAWGPYTTYAAAFESRTDFEQVFRWFREREDVENEVHRTDPNHADAQLVAVRRAVEAILSTSGGSTYTNLHVRRPKHAPSELLPQRRAHLEIDKDGQPLAFDQLSEGERTMVAMAADIARRLAIADPGAEEPLAGNGVVLIDEVELHLHPQWQAEILDRLLATFPGIQFIVTTHSPLVVTSVAVDQLRVLRDFGVHAPASPTRGRDVAALLSEVFETPPRPKWALEKIAEIAALLDAEHFDEARARLGDLAKAVSEQDEEVIRLGTALELLAG